MKYSVITICRNCVDTILETLTSVTRQQFNDFEYLVIDGCSSDGTLEVIKTFDEGIDRVLSQDPEGIYSALNLGLSAARGEYIVFVHGGDVFKSDFTLHQIDVMLSEPNIDILYGGKDYLSVDRTAIVRSWVPSVHKKWKWWFGWMPPHLGCVVKNDVYQKIGAFDESFLIAGDYDFLLRAFYIHDLNYKRFGEVLVEMGSGGISHSSLGSMLLSNIEVLRSWHKNCRWIPLWVFFLKPLSKLFQMTLLYKK